MPIPFLIVDGYNLMHAAGLARRRFGPGGLEKARQRLLALLVRHLAEEQRQRTTVVFDAYREAGHRSPATTHDAMTIRFAPEDSDADTLIEELIAAHSAPKQILVVSGDRRLHRAATRRKGRAIESERFLRELKRETAPLDPADDVEHPKRTGTVSDLETEAWLAVFEAESNGDDDSSPEDDLARRLQDEVDGIVRDADGGTRFDAD